MDRPEVGVTVVVASHRPPDEVVPTLESLARQTLSRRRFEIVLVVNGPQSSNVELYDRFASAHGDLDLRVVRSPLPGACHALNLGIQSARMGWVTFVDDDDTVSDAFLEGLLSVAMPGMVPLAFIDDVLPDGNVSTSNRINDKLRLWEGRAVPPEQASVGLTFNASKLIPTDWARSVLYDNRLSSGQDIAFFAGIYSRFDFEFAVVPRVVDAVYRRGVSDLSQSRRPLDFDFAVTERLAVIEVLEEELSRAPQRKKSVVRSLMRAQALFIRRYVDKQPEERPRVNQMIREGPGSAFPWDVLTRGAATGLVTSVCFAPYSDASATTMAKRILLRGEVVDVVAADMSRVRRVDPSLDRVASGLISTVMTVGGGTGFGDWAGAKQYALEGWRRIEKATHGTWPYRSVYSRAMWPASHVLGALVKARRPDVVWMAEFSDPISRTVEGAMRLGTLVPDELFEELVGAATESGLQFPRPRTLFEFAELVPFALADELVFINESQMEYMLEYCPSRELAEAARKRARIDPHPVLPPAYYVLEQTERPSTDRVAIAYFGSFYSNRSLVEVFSALERLDYEDRRKLVVDVYTDDREALERTRLERRLFDVVRVFDSVPFLDFLNVATHYDCLLVNDASTARSHRRNPYLPSKWSDYAGSGTAIWKVFEPGSPMSRFRTTYSSQLGDVESAMEVLRAVVAAGASQGVGGRDVAQGGI